MLSAGQLPGQCDSTVYVALQVADHVRAHPIWRRVCYKDGRIPSDAPLDTTQLVDREVAGCIDSQDL